MSKIIHCALWGDIEVSPLALQIIDTPIFQRLHYIHQCGFSYKVFPCATHTRFQHSIGVYYLVRLFIDTLIRKQPVLDTLSNRTKELIAISGLIHDLGHGPFSHVFDSLLIELLGDDVNTHEKRTEWLFHFMVKEYKIDLSSTEIDFILSRIISPSRDIWYDHLIYNPFYHFDLDKIDYLLRDSLFYGLHQKIDVTRILQNCRIINNTLCFSNRIIDEIRFIFQLRLRMYDIIYNHHKVRFYDNLFIHLCKHFYKNEILLSLKNPLSFIELTDYTLIGFLQSFSLWKQADIRKPLSLYPKEFYKPKQQISVDSILETISFYDRKKISD